MNWSKIFGFLFFSMFCFKAAQAQDTLPEFRVEEINGRVVISWNNRHTNLVQVTVQRSYDSVKRFTSIYNAPSPELPANGFTDTKVQPGIRVFYRIFYMMEGGAYYFTASKRPSAGTSSPGFGFVTDYRRDQLYENLLLAFEGRKPADMHIPPGQQYEVRFRDTSNIQVGFHQLREMRDSLLEHTKDTLFQLNDTTFYLATFIYNPPYEEIESRYVNFDANGYLIITISDADRKKYHLEFLDENDQPVVTISPVPGPYLILDKSNFRQAGWYKIQLKTGNTVLERNRIFIPKDF